MCYRLYTQIKFRINHIDLSFYGPCVFVGFEESFVGGCFLESFQVSLVGNIEILILCDDVWPRHPARPLDLWRRLGGHILARGGSVKAHENMILIII